MKILLKSKFKKDFYRNIYLQKILNLKKNFYKKIRNFSKTKSIKKLKLI